MNIFLILAVALLVFFFGGLFFLHRLAKRKNRELYGDGREMSFLRVWEGLKAGDVRNASNEYFFGNLPKGWVLVAKELATFAKLCVLVIVGVLAYLFFIK